MGNVNYHVILLLLLLQHAEVSVGSVEDDIDVDKDATADDQEAGLDQEHGPREVVQAVGVDPCEEGG